MSAKNNLSSLEPRPKPDDYYTDYPPTITYGGDTWKETFNTAGRWCESEQHPTVPHGPLPTSSSLVDSAECPYKRYAGGRVVDRSRTVCWHLYPLVRIFGPPTWGPSFVPHHIGKVRSEAADTVGAIGYGHDVAVALSEARLSGESSYSHAQAVISKHNRYGGRIGPEDWFVYTKVGSNEGDPDRHIISEDGMVLSQATAEQLYELLKDDDKSDTGSVTIPEGSFADWEVV